MNKKDAKETGEAILFRCGMTAITVFLVCIGMIFLGGLVTLSIVVLGALVVGIGLVLWARTGNDNNKGE